MALQHDEKGRLRVVFEIPFDNDGSDGCNWVSQVMLPNDGQWVRGKEHHCIYNAENEV